MHDEIADVDARRCRRVGLVSDSHGPVDGRILATLNHCDFLIHAGDLGGGAALSALLGLAPTTAVRGNNDTIDRWPKADINQFNRLPSIVRIALTGGHIIVIHGHQYPQAKKRHVQLRERFSSALAIVYGHSHRMVMDTDHSPWVLNPGACGRVRTYGGPSGLLLERKIQRWDVALIRV